MDATKILEVLDIYDKRLADFKHDPVIPERANPTEHYRGPDTNRAKLCHVWWAVGQTKVFVQEGRLEKAFRWLGFIQGALWFAGIYSVEELANHNKPAGEESNLDPNRASR